MPYICRVPPICSSAPPKLPTAPPAPRCPYGWQYLEASGLCYAFLEHERHEYTWDEASTLCSEAGGGLASIPNRALNDAIVVYALEAKLGDDDYWLVAIGASYNSSASSWEWTDGSAMQYANWDVGEPHQPWAYKCGFLMLAYPDFGKWVNSGCNESGMAAICERAPFDTVQGGALPPPNLPAPPPPVRCPQSWHYLETTDLCYGVIEYKGIKSTNTSYWDDVKTACSDAGGGLISIPSKAVNDAILGL
ncbi:mannose receptor C type 1-like protein [Aphelenchoides avenae]|nr:mannose receptor C type 1-like protein [Aphelenchus avenae]